MYVANLACLHVAMHVCIYVHAIIAGYVATYVAIWLHFIYQLTVLIDVKYICTHVVITVNLCISIYMLMLTLMHKPYTLMHTHYISNL